jgi:nucleoside-diphosphate-sugar epimerase
MHALVTGAAGFIGSHLVERLLSDGHRVRGVDCFTATYDPVRKRDHLKDALSNGYFELVTADLRRTDLARLLHDVDVVYHLAGQPGVRTSWGPDFNAYVDNNIVVTQLLLEEASRHGLDRFVFASSSSVYGEAPNWPTDEDAPTRPRSPYGVTKLAAEHLCRVYASNHRVPTVELRYFTVYGPRQRPDMALHRLLSAALTGTPFPLYGDGERVRDFTYVGDVVAATATAGVLPLEPGTVLNVAGGSATSLADLIAMVEAEVGRPVPIERHNVQPGDVDRTGGDTSRARRLLGWEPRTGVRDGVAAQADWQRRQ